MKNEKAILKAADKLAKAYRAWIVANAAYNILLVRDTACESMYTINFAGLDAELVAARHKSMVDLMNELLEVAAQTIDRKAGE